MPDDRQALLILQALRPGWPRAVSTISAATGLRQPLVVKTLDRLNDQGAVVRTRRGEYQLPGAGD
jgi:DNA-binding IclR family transcriptional regulator